MTNPSTGSGFGPLFAGRLVSAKNSRKQTMRFARFQRLLIVALCGLAVALSPHRSSAQQVTYYDFNTPSTTPSLTSTSCTVSSATSGVLLCLNNVGGGLSFIQDNSYTTVIDPNATGGTAYALQLTQQNVPSQWSSVWYSIPQNVAGGFTAWYAFKITPGSSPYGDGLAFVIQNSLGGGTDPITGAVETGSGLSVLGGYGGGIGYGGIDNSIALEADTFVDDYDPWDLAQGYYDDNHIALQGCGPGLANSPAHYTSNAVSPLVPTSCLINLSGTYAIASNPSSSAGTGTVNVADGNPHQVVIVYNPPPNNSPLGSISVYLDPAFNPGTHTPVTGSTPIIAGPYNIANSMNLNNGTAYIGFTAATGGSTEQHELMGFTFTPYGYGNANVCPAGATTPAPCSSTIPVTFNFTQDTAIGSIQVVTQGATGLDFQPGTGSTCTGTITAGNSCTVNVTFAPLAPGSRMGAVNLLDGGGNVLATRLVHGTGQAPELVFAPTFSGNAIAAGPSLENVVTVPGYTLTPHAMATDAAGDLFIADSNNGIIVKLAANGTTSTVGVGLQSPQAIAVDGAGDVFIANTWSGQQEVVEVPAGCTTSACQIPVYQAAVGAPAPPDPVSLAVDGMGDLFIVDLTIEGVVEIPAGCTTSSCRISIGGGWSDPAGVAIDAAGDLFVTDNILGKVFEVPAGCTVNSCQSTVGSGWGSPHGVAADAAGDIYVADPGINGGEVLEVPAGCTNNSCEVPLLSGTFIFNVAVDAAGQVYVSEPYTSVPQILKINQNPSQALTASFLPTTWGIESSDSPQSLTLLNVGNQTLNAISPGFTIGVDWLQDANGYAPNCTTNSSLAPGQGCNLSIDFDPQGGSGPSSLASSVYLWDNSLNGNPTQEYIYLTGSTTGGGGNNYTLTVTGAGTGSGSVTSNSSASPAVNCAISGGSVTGTCSESDLSGTQVTLTAAATAGSTFTGWGGACASAGTSPQCAVTMNAAENVSASFAPGIFGSANDCSSELVPPCSTTMTVPFSFGANGTSVGSVQVLTQGYTILDFQEASDTCSNRTFNQGDSCSVSVTFTPLAVGLRLGAVQLLAPSSSSVLLSQPIYGIGEGSVAAFSPLTVFGRYLGGPSGTAPNSVPLNLPRGVAVDASGNVFISDTGNQHVLELTGNTTNIVYDGSSFSTASAPQGLAVDGAGNLYVADPGLGAVTEVLLNGAGYTTVYSGAHPTGVAVDGSGDVFVAVDDHDGEGNGVVVEISPTSGQTLMYAPGGAVPEGLAVDSAGNLYIADSFLQQVMEIPFGCNAQNINNCQTTVGSGWSAPESVAVDAAGDVYVTDTGLGKVVEIPAGCIGLTCQISIASGVQSYGLAVDPVGVVSFVDYANGSLSQVLQEFFGMNFGYTDVGTAGLTQSTTLQNIGNQPLNASGSGLQITDPDFVRVAGSGTPVDCATNFSLVPGTNCNVSIAFDPLSAGMLSGNGIFNDDAVNGSQDFALNGTGVGGVIGGNLLVVGETGSGSGTVTDDSGLIQCVETIGSTTGKCAANYSSGQTVTLTANPAPGSTFAGWGGACGSSGTSATCTVAMSQAQNVSASFAKGGVATSTFAREETLRDARAAVRR